MKLVPSMVAPTTSFYVVDVTAPDLPPLRAASAPMVQLDPATDEWWGYPTGPRHKCGPYEDSRAAMEAVAEILTLNQKLED
jgi:hypothetical protein